MFLAYLTPIVQILVNGGVSSILTVCASIERNTPVIVINVFKIFASIYLTIIVYFMYFRVVVGLRILLPLNMNIFMIGIKCDR